MSEDSNIDQAAHVYQGALMDVFPQEALDNLMLEGDNIVSAARRAIMRHDYSAVLTIFPILRHLKLNKSEFDSTLQVRTVASAAVSVGGRLARGRLRSLCAAGDGGEHQEQAAHAHHLHGNHRSQGPGGVRRQHQGNQHTSAPGIGDPSTIGGDRLSPDLCDCRTIQIKSTTCPRTERSTS